jgi:hypothetical protein
MTPAASGRGKGFIAMTDALDIRDIETIRAIKAAAPLQEGLFDEIDMADTDRLLTACCLAFLRDDDDRRVDPAEIKALLVAIQNGSGSWLDFVGAAFSKPIYRERSASCSMARSAWPAPSCAISTAAICDLEAKDSGPTLRRRGVGTARGPRGGDLPSELHTEKMSNIH